MNSSHEEWRTVPGFGARYEVSNIGRVRSIDTQVRNKQGLRIQRGRVLKQQMNSAGYWTVTLFNLKERRHSTVSGLMGAAFLGVQPGAKTDHVNRQRHDNRVANLRPATTSQNGFNAKTRSNNTSGLKGASFFPSRNKWRSTITVNGRQQHLGYFDSPEPAHAAYMSAAIKFANDFACAGRAS